MSKKYCCMMGPQGPQGEPGVSGDQGEQGPQGLIGNQGPPGITGSPGPMGLSIIGPPGPMGNPGVMGSVGPIGPPGSMGKPGPMGPQGEKGDIGITGPTGPQGPTGIRGPTGVPDLGEIFFDIEIGDTPCDTPLETEKLYNQKKLRFWSKGNIVFDLQTSSANDVAVEIEPNNIITQAGGPTTAPKDITIPSLLFDSTNNKLYLWDPSKSFAGDWVSISLEGINQELISICGVVGQALLVNQTDGFLALVPNRTGFITANVPDNTIVGGRCRGINSIDLQMKRNNVYDVAAGDYSVICGGRNNLIDTFSNCSSILGGDGNKIYGHYNNITGGLNGYIEGMYNNISSGVSNKIQNSFRTSILSGTRNFIENSTNSCILGGSCNLISNSSGSIIGGFKSYSLYNGCFVFGDSTVTPVTTTGTDQIILQATGGMQVLGDLDVTGNLTKGSGAFKIDHPIHPKTKYLQHSFVESDKMLNIYQNIDILDENGQKEIKLPDWFIHLNKDFSYQLTPIGRPCNELYIKKEIENNCFTIGSNIPFLKVSWMVTGVRKDKYSLKYPIKIEVNKEKEGYLYPELYE